MSRDEFISTTKAYNKHGVAFVGILLLFVFVSFIGYLTFEEPFQKIHGIQISGNTSNALTAVPLFLSMFLVFVFTTISRVKRERKLRILCPHCTKNLTGTAMYQGIVIASRNCPYCGMKVLEETP